MAKILDQEQQKKALDNINESIKAMKKINEFLQAANPSGNYTLSFKDADDKKRIAEIHMADNAGIVSLLVGFKQKEKERIAALAEENRIELDPEDHDIMDFQV